jgi:hypothetical protein
LDLSNVDLDDNSVLPKVTPRKSDKLAIDSAIVANEETPNESNL